MNIAKEDIKRILIVKLCCLGDVIQMLPAVNVLKNNYPDSKITLLADAWVSPLKNYFTDIDDVLILKNAFSKSIFSKISSAIWLVTKLNKLKFDLALVGHRNNIFGRIVYLAGIRYRLGFSGTSHINIPTEFNPALNESRRYLELLSSAGISSPDINYGFNVNESSIDIKKKIGILENKEVIGIFPFGGINPGMDMRVKRWEAEKFYEVGTYLSNNYPDKEILFFEGTGEDEKISSKFESRNVRVIPIGVNYISICNFFIGNDTGSLHIANALGIRSVGIFGPTAPEVFGPFDSTENVTFIVNKVNCSPCFNTDIAMDKKNQKYWERNKFKCHTGTHECMKGLSIETVIDEINKILK